MNDVFLSLGGNIGDRIHYLSTTKELIDETIGDILKASPIYETAAWGVTDQPQFLNQVIEISTNLSPIALLQATQAIEKAMDRKRKQKWGPRTMDIDILYYHNDIIDTPSLSIPHPFIASRKFVLQPLCDIAALKIHPLLKKSQLELMRACDDPLVSQIYNVT